MASFITVEFDHPEVSDDGVVALVSVAGTTVNSEPVRPGQTRRFDLDPDDYAVTVAVTSLEGTDWTINLEATGGDSQSEDGTGSDTAVFPVVTVEEA